MRIATSLTNFGSELKPDWVSPYTGETRSYDGYDPPLMFRYGVAFEPLENAKNRVTYALEVNQPADNQRLVKMGLEWSYLRQFAAQRLTSVRTRSFSAGAGFTADLGQKRVNLDYAYTGRRPAGRRVNRLSLGVRF